MGFCLERPVPPKVWEARWWFLSHGGFAILLLRTEPVNIMAQLLTHLTAECPTSLIYIERVCGTPVEPMKT